MRHTAKEAPIGISIIPAVNAILSLRFSQTCQKRKINIYKTQHLFLMANELSTERQNTVRYLIVHKPEEIELLLLLFCRL